MKTVSVLENEEFWRWMDGWIHGWMDGSGGFTTIRMYLRSLCLKMVKYA